MKNVILVTILSLLVSGCYVQSLNVFYTDDAKTSVPELIGEWKPEIQMGESVTNKQITSWRFTTNTVETYDEDNTYSELEVVYFKVKDSYFMDFTAGEPLKDKDSFGNFYWGAGLTLVHSLCKLEIKENELIIIPLDLEWFTDRIDEGKMTLPWVKAKHKDSNYIFTATPEEWMKFLKKHKDSNSVFNPEYKFVFMKSEGLHNKAIDSDKK